MANNYTTTSLEAIKFLCGLIRDLASVSEGVDDLHIRSDGTFSSVKIDTLIKQCLQDSNDYTDRLVANLSRLELKLVTDESEITQPNTMYLFKPSGATSYNQYVVIDGNKVLLGTCDIDMADYYTITQADAKFTLLTDFNDLKTAYDTHAADADVHVTKELKDKLVTTDDITTTIDSSSTDAKVPSALAIYNGIKELETKTTLKNLFPANYYNLPVYTANGVTSTINDDGSITFNGTSTGTHFSVIYHRDYNGHGEAVKLRGKTITLSGGKTSPVLSLAFYDEDGNNVTPPDNAMKYDTGKGLTITVPDNAYSIYSYYYTSQGTYNNITLYPMLEEGDVAHNFISPKDTKLTKGDIVTTIDSSSTDDTFPSAKAVNAKFNNMIIPDYSTSDTMNVNFNKTGLYKFNNPTKGVPENNVGDYMLLNIPWKNCYPNTGIYAYQLLFSPRCTGFWTRVIWNYNPDTYVYTEGDYSVFKKWKSVGYLQYGQKEITFNDETNYKPTSVSKLRYVITNNVCYVTGGIDCVAPVAESTVSTDIPEAYIDTYAKGMNINGEEDTDPIKIFIHGSTLELRRGVAGKSYRFSFSYPLTKN